MVVEEEEDKWIWTPPCSPRTSNGDTDPMFWSNTVELHHISSSFDSCSTSLPAQFSTLDVSRINSSTSFSNIPYLHPSLIHSLHSAANITTATPLQHALFSVLHSASSSQTPSNFHYLITAPSHSSKSLTSVIIALNHSLLSLNSPLNTSTSIILCMNSENARELCFQTKQFISKFSSNSESKHIEACVIDEMYIQNLLDFQDDDNNEVIHAPNIIFCTPFTLLKLLEFHKLDSTRIGLLIIDDLNLMLDNSSSTPASNHRPIQSAFITEFTTETSDGIHAENLSLILSQYLLETIQMICFSSECITESLQDWMHSGFLFNSHFSLLKISLSRTHKSISEQQSIELKDEANDLFRKKQYLDAEKLYTSAMNCLELSNRQKAVLYSNRAACRAHRNEVDNIVSRDEQLLAVIRDCERSIACDTTYEKPLIRHIECCKTLSQFTKALESAKRLYSLNPSALSLEEIKKLEQLSKQQTEKQTAEALEQLKQLGNTFLSSFGMSLDNFNFQKDPESGSYNMKFQH